MQNKGKKRWHCRPYYPCRACRSYNTHNFVSLCEIGRALEKNHIWAIEGCIITINCINEWSNGKSDKTLQQ